MGPHASTTASSRSGGHLAAQDRHFVCLDGVRALAAGLVFVHHIGFLTGATFTTGVGKLLGRLDVGVPIFFAISGFLLFRRPAAAIFDDTPLPSWRTHYQRRFFRIYPTYWVVLACIAATIGIEARTRDLALHILLLQIYRGEAFLDGISQSWSLAVEISFYLVLPWLARLLQSLVRGYTTGAKAVSLLGVFVVLAGLSNAWRMFVYAGPLHDRAVFWLPGTIDYFAIGMGFAVIAAWADREQVGAEIAAMLGRRDLLWWAAAAAIALFVSYEIELEVGLDRATWHKELFRQFGYDAIAFCVLVPAVFGPPTVGIVRRLLQSKPLVALGAISYSFYLWHIAVIETWIRWRDLATPLGFLDWATTTLVSFTMFEVTVGSFIVTTLLATLTYYVIERPAQRLVARLTR